MRPILALALCSLAVSTSTIAASAQNAVLPAAAATTKPNAQTFTNSQVFYSTRTTTTPSDSRTQSIYDVNEIPMAAAVWTGLHVRRPHGFTTANLAFTANATIVMSVSPTAYGAAVTTFASNHGPNPTTVLSGPISLPARADPPTWPAPWEAPFPFTTPFVYARGNGQSLVIDIHQTGNTGGQPWYLEATYPQAGGGRVSNPSAQSTCKFSNGKYNNAIAHRNPLVGGTWYVNYQGGLPAGLSAIGALGTQGVGGTWAGVPLPIDLSPFGAPGCSWSVSADVTMPLAGNPSGIYTWPTLPIPNDPTLAGKDFYDHALFLDPGANAWGVVTSWSSRWIIGPIPGAQAATVAVTGAGAAGATGALTQNAVVTMQLKL